MPVPSLITDLSATAASNSPSGSEAPTEGDNHLRTAYAFIKQLYDGVSGVAYPTLAQLASTANAADGAGLVEEDLSLNYVAGTLGWWDRHAGVSLLRWMPVNTWAAIIAGTNTTNLATYLQTALDDALASNFELNGHGYTYKSNSALTWQRSSSGHSTRLSLHSATFDFTGMGTTGSAFTVGATSTTYFIEQGRIILRDITLLGPESTSLDPRTDAPGTSTVGLDLQFAGGVTLDSVNVFQFYNQCHSLFAFPVKAINCNFRRAWIGLHLDEVSNDQDWDGVTLVNCRYPILIKAVSTSLDSGKINNVTIRRAWCEGCRVGPVIDSGSGGGGATPIRGITFEMPYMALITNDHFRFGTVWTLATPDTRGSNCSEFISDIRIVGGLFNPQSGVYSATQALVCFDTNVRCRDVFIDTCTLDSDADSDVFVGAPGGGLYVSRGFAGTSNAKYRISLWDVNGAFARRMVENGSILVGTAKTATATTGTVGHELKENGVLYTTVDGSTVWNCTRLNSDGTVVNFRRDSTSVGSIAITTTNTAYNTTSDYRRKDNVHPLDGATALASVLSWPIRTFTWKVNGAPDVGVIAHELQAVKPSAVHGEKDAVDENGEEIPQGVDYSKLMPETVAAVQYLSGIIDQLQKAVSDLQSK